MPPTITGLGRDEKNEIVDREFDRLASPGNRYPGELKRL